MECSKGKKYSFLCPIFGYTITGENVRGSIYGWVGRFTICMVSALYRLRGAQIILYWRPWRTSKAPQSLPVDSPFVRAIHFVLFFFAGPWARLYQGSSLGLEPILLCCLLILSSFLVISYWILFHVIFHFLYLSCYLCLNTISSNVMLYHFVSCCVFSYLFTLNVILFFVINHTLN